MTPSEILSYLQEGYKLLSRDTGWWLVKGSAWVPTGWQEDTDRSVDYLKAKGEI